MKEKFHDHLVSTFLEYDGREITVTVLHDGISYWQDTSAVRKLNKAQPGYTMLSMIDEQAKKHLHNVIGEHTIKAKLPDDVFQKIRDEISPRYWADKHVPDDVLDALLEPTFREQVVPYL